MGNKHTRNFAIVGTFILALTAIGHLLSKNNLPDCGDKKVTDTISKIVMRQPGVAGNTVIRGFSNSKQLSDSDGVRTCRIDMAAVYQDEDEETTTIEYRVNLSDSKKKTIHVKLTNFY